MDDEEVRTFSEPERGRPSRRRLLTLGVAGAVAAAGVAAGWGVHDLRQDPATASTSWQGRSSWSVGRPPVGMPRSAATGSGPTAASSDQVTGLVRIVAGSPYVGSTAVGTGMVLTSSGEVVTNNHVVAGSTSIRATVLATGRTYTARLLGTDTRDDVAVLQLQGASGLTPVATSTTGVQPGDTVTAVGDAGGLTGLSASPGTVTAVRRSITTSALDGSSSEHLRGLIQVAADVVSGDSGGALLAEDGQVVGMTTAASSGSPQVTGYAIPVARVLRLVHQVDAGVRTTAMHLGYAAFLGIELPTGSPSPTVAGGLRGTPAARAGLTAGSVVTSIGGRPVATAAQLHRLVAAHRPGDVVRVGWTDAAGTFHHASVRLARGPAA